MIDVEALEALVDDRIRRALEDRASAPVLLRVPEAAELLGMSTRTAYQRISEGTLEAVRDHGQLRVTREAVEAYAAGCEAAGPPRRSERVTSTRKARARIVGEGW